MKAIVVDAPGGPEAMRIDDVPDPDPAPGEVVIQVAAAGVNRADVWQRMGFYPPPPGASPILGLEVSGTVVAIGEGTAGASLNSRVMALLEGGGYAEMARVAATQVMQVPDSVDMISAAGIPEVFITAHNNLFSRARLRPAETLLVHGGAGGVGTAAIQLAKRHHCRVIVTAGSPDKLAQCAVLGADFGINYRTEDFVERVREITDSHGADVILDVMGAAYLARNVDTLAVDGRLVVIGHQGGTSAELDLAALSRKRVTIIGTELRARPRGQKAAIIEAFSAEVLPGFAGGSLHAVIDRTYPLARAPDAHRALESGDVIGKIVLEVAPP